MTSYRALTDSDFTRNLFAMQDDLIEVKKKFGARVRRLRQERGWSQERLALESGIGRGFAGAIERGEKAAGMPTLLKLAQVFEITLAKLLTGIEDAADCGQGDEQK